MAETIGRADIIILADGKFFEASVRQIVKNADIDKVGKETGEKLGKSFNSARNKETEKGDRDWSRRLRNRLDKAGADFDKFGNKVGRIFGKGSRNDALNMFGGIMSMSGRLPAVLARLGSSFAGVGDKIKEMVSSGDISGMLKGIGGGVGALVAAAAAIKVMVSLMSVLGAAVSLTTGLVLALAGSLGFALVAGIGAVAGALVPLAAGLGVAALAMAGLDKKSGVMKDLKKEWEGLQKTAATAVFGKDLGGLKSLQGVLKAIEPLVKTVGEALGGLLRQFGKATGTKEFAKMISDIGDAIGPMVTKLGGIGGTFLQGIGQAFIAAEPVINKFLGFLQDVADSFLNLSKGGDKSALAGIFDEGAKSAKIIWDLVKNVGKAILVLFSAGKDTGDNIFAGLAEKAQELVKWLTSPDGQKALKQWFADAQKLAGAIGDVVLKVIKFIDALDTPESRAKLLLILDIIGKIISALTWLVNTTNAWTTKFFQMLASVISFMKGVWEAFISWNEGMPARLEAAWASVTGFFQGLWTGIATTAAAIWNGIINGVSAAWQRLVMRAGEAKAGVMGAWAGVVAFFTGIGNSIATAWGNATGRLKQRMNEAKLAIVAAFAGIKAKISAVPGQIAGVFTGLAGKVITKAGNLASAFARWVSSLAGKAKSTVTSVISAFSGLAGKVIAKAGSLASKFASWLASIPGKAKTAANNVVNAFAGVAGKIISKMGSLADKLAGWGRSAVSKAKGVANDIVSAFKGLASRIVQAIGTIIPKIKMPSIKVPTVVAKVITPKKAAGGIVNGAQVVTVGEAGPEAIVPLNRALSRVDPAVRALSAYAQGLSLAGSANNAGPSIGRQIDVGGITINTPSEDPRAVASEVVARMTYAAYI